MKKLITLLSVPSVLLVAWGGATWYIGQQTETTLKRFIDEQNQASASSGIKQELVSYEKSTLGATAITKLSMDMPPLAGLGDIQFINEIRNGPVFIGGGSLVQFGTAQIHSQLDTAALTPEQREWVKTAFAGKAPLDGHTVIGFDGNMSYHFTTNPLQVDQDGTTAQMDSVTLSGTLAPDMTGKLSLQAGKIEIKDTTARFTLPSMQLDVNMTGMIGGQVLGTYDLKMPGMSILAEETTVPVGFDLAVQSESGITDNELAVKIATQATNIQGVDDTLSKLDFKLDVNGLDVAGAEELGKLQAELQNLQNQMLWSAEATETPEGQQKQQELMTQLSDTTGKAVETLFAKVLKTDKSRLHTTLVTESPKGKLSAGIDLTYTGKEAPDLIKLAGYETNDWAKLMQGKMTLDADKALLPAGAEIMLTPLSEQGLLAVDDKKITTAIDLAGENVTLNGKQMPFVDFVALLAPEGMDQSPGEEVSDPNMGIPEDLMKKIEMEGLTPEIIQLLEESDDVPKDTLQIMKQLQQMQEQMGASEGAAAPAADANKE